MKSSKKLICISDLSEVEKAKVARLVEKLVSIGKVNEQLQLELNNVNKQNELECYTIRHEHMSLVLQKDEEINDLSSKLTMSMGLLKLYQNKVIEYDEQFSKESKNHLRSDEQVSDLKEEVKRLDSLMQNQQFTISNTKEKLTETEEMYSALLESSGLLEAELYDSKEKLVALESELKKTNQLLLKEIDNKNTEVEENKQLQKLNKELENTLTSTMAVNEQQQLELRQRVSSDSGNADVTSSTVLPPRGFTEEPVVQVTSGVANNELKKNRIINNPNTSVTPGSASNTDKKRSLNVNDQNQISSPIATNERKKSLGSPYISSNRSVNDITTKKKKAIPAPPGKHTLESRSPPTRSSDGLPGAQKGNDSGTKRKVSVVGRSTTDAVPVWVEPLPWDEPEVMTSSPVRRDPVYTDVSDNPAGAGRPLLLNLSSDEEGSLNAIIASQRRSAPDEFLDSSHVDSHLNPIIPSPKVTNMKKTKEMSKTTRSTSNTNHNHTKNSKTKTKNKNTTRTSTTSVDTKKPKSRPAPAPASSSSTASTSISRLNPNHTIQSRSFIEGLQPHRPIVTNSGVVTRKSVRLPDESISVDATHRESTSTLDTNKKKTTKNTSIHSTGHKHPILKSNINSTIPVPYSRYDEDRLLNLMSDMNI